MDLIDTMINSIELYSKKLINYKKEIEQQYLLLFKEKGLNTNKKLHIPENPFLPLPIHQYNGI